MGMGLNGGIGEVNKACFIFSIKQDYLHNLKKIGSTLKYFPFLPLQFLQASHTILLCDLEVEQ